MTSSSRTTSSTRRTTTAARAWWTCPASSRGNLYDQGREIAAFKPYDPKGFTANAPFVMNAMPWKGNVLFTDFNSGLWSAKLEPRPTPTPTALE